MICGPWPQDAHGGAFTAGRSKAHIAAQFRAGSSSAGLRVRGCGDRNFVPHGGATNSAHLSGQAADFHVVGMTDSKADSELKQNASPVADGFRVIQQGVDTVTEGAHIHVDSRSDPMKPTDFMNEGMSPQITGVYTHDHQ